MILTLSKFLVPKIKTGIKEHREPLTAIIINSNSHLIPD